MSSDYVIQVVEKKTGAVVEWAPGMAVERQLITDLCGRVASKGVGIGKTTAHVVADIHAALTELLHALKSEV